ncbi:MAG: peptidylprolyl isomerase [Bacteroidota bacterium]
MHSSRSKILVLLFLLLLGCSKEEKKSRELVRINDAVLTEDELRIALSDPRNFGKNREEYINEWIEQQILYQQAVDEGIVNGSEYNLILETTKKRLASSMLLEKLIEENSFEPGKEEIEKYFEEYKDDFKLNNDSYRLNIAYFNNREKAAQFRTLLIESDWDKALNAYRLETSLTGTVTSEVYSDYRLQPVNLQRAVQVLMPGEVSIVLETEPMKFAVVQLLEKLYQGDVPKFETVANEVKARYVIVKRKDFVKQYIDKLIEDHNIEIKRY